MPTIKCVQVRPNQFTGKTTLADIRSNCPDPRRVDRATEAEKAKDPDLARAAKQRGKNQRVFDKARTLRAINYARYIKEVDEGTRLGGYPSVTLWTGEEATYDVAAATLTLGGASILTANDGETQLAARYMLAFGFSVKGFPTVEQDDKWLDQPFAITLATASTIEAAMQTLHDMNRYAVPVSEKNTAVLNVEGALTKAINAGIKAAAADSGTIKAKGLHRSSEPYFTSMATLLHGAVGALYGADAFKRSVNAHINEANSQAVNLNGKGAVVSKFIEKTLLLPPSQLRRLDSEHMMALGARFSGQQKMPKPLDESQYKKVDAEIRSESNGKRNTVTRRALRIYEVL